ncbi:AMP-binding protein [Catenulispora yoronensis]
MATRIARRERTSAALAPVQWGVWIASSQGLDDDPYLVHDLSWVHGALDAAILRDSLAELARRHDALRISFTAGSDPVQTVHDTVGIAFETVDLADRPDADRPDADRAALDLARDRSRQPFDLTAAPLWRVLLVRVAEDRHLLQLTIHHLICDEWSLNLIHRDLEAEYAARIGGGRTPPPAPDTPGYGDFADWQAERFNAAPGERSLKYWRETLDGIPHELDLPTDHARTGTVTHTGHKAGWSLTSQESAEFKELADGLGVSPFLVMVTLFGVVLARHSGRPDLALGTVLSGRPTTATETMVGHFANLLPIPLRLDDDLGFAEAVRTAKKEFLGLLDHQDITFDRIVTELGARRPDLRMPLCQAHISWSEGGEGGWSLGPARTEPVGRDTGSAKAELVLAGVRRRGELSFELIGETAFFDVATLRVLMDHFRAAAKAAIADSGTSVRALNLVSGAEAERLRRWGGSGRRDGIEATIAQRFEEAVAEHADRIAVVDADRALTYAELDARSARWAAELRRLGVTTDTVVGVALDRSTEMIAAVVGILRAGGAYLALNVDSPADYNAFCVAESKAAVVVARQGTLEILGDVSCPVLLSEDVDDGAASGNEPDEPAAPAEALQPTCTPDSLAFVSYTSGSTGKPKCVGITHRNILRVSYASERILHGPGATFVHLAPLGFDISAMELWACLLHGGRLVVPPHGRLDVPELAAILRQESVTTWVTTTALFNQLVEQDLEALAEVGQVLIGGESAAPAAFDKVTADPRTRGVSLLHCYGPTENTCVTTNTVIAERVGATVPIGTPIEGSTVYLLDDALAPVPVGVPGELYTGGVGVSRGT